jgi:predicted O-methyltransferase YrrM
VEAHRDLYEGHPLASRIQIHHGDAEAVFQGEVGSWDVVFVDCDKAGYARTLALCADRIRPGGLLLADNVLWGGKVARQAEEEDASTRGLQDFNRLLAADSRFSYRILPAGDGLGVALKLS